MRLQKIVALMGLCAVAVALAACPPQAYGVLTNAVGEPVSLTVFRRDQTHFSGGLGASNTLLLADKPDALEAVEYRYGDRVCRLEGEDLEWTSVEKGSLPQLALMPCGTTDVR